MACGDDDDINAINNNIESTNENIISDKKVKTNINENSLMNGSYNEKE